MPWSRWALWWVRLPLPVDHVNSTPFVWRPFPFWRLGIWLFQKEPSNCCFCRVATWQQRIPKMTKWWNHFVLGRQIAHSAQIATTEQMPTRTMVNTSMQQRQGTISWCFDGWYRNVSSDARFSDSRCQRWTIWKLCPMKSTITNWRGSVMVIVVHDECKIAIRGNEDLRH